MRSKFDKALDNLHRMLIDMGEMCEDVIDQASEALLDGNKELAKKIMEEDSPIDQEERDIESLCLKLLLTQQPVARDLRQISSALKMITDMERIGDQAEDIAELVYEIQHNELRHKELVRKLPFKEMADATMWMLSTSILAYVKSDAELAEEVIKYDDVVDGHFDTIRDALADYISAQHTSESKEAGIYAVDLLMIAKYYERIGDHTTNIAEWVWFAFKGEHYQKQ